MTRIHLPTTDRSSSMYTLNIFPAFISCHSIPSHFYFSLLVYIYIFLQLTNFSSFLSIAFIYVVQCHSIYPIFFLLNSFFFTFFLVLMKHVISFIMFSLACMYITIHTCIFYFHSLNTPVSLSLFNFLPYCSSYTSSYYTSATYHEITKCL